MLPRKIYSDSIRRARHRQELAYRRRSRNQKLTDAPSKPQPEVMKTTRIQNLTSNIKASHEDADVSTVMESNNIYLHNATLDCVLEKRCIPCLYKVFPQGKTGFPPNQRPEVCPRSKLEFVSSCIFEGAQRILLVGDGDFSFSLSVARILSQSRLKKTNIIATSHESYNVVVQTYSSAERHIIELKSLGVLVYHEIDATNLSSSEALEKFKLSFDAVVWNFPCTRMERGADAQVSELDCNKTLIRRFFASVREFLHPRRHGKEKSSCISDADVTVECYDSSPPGRVFVTHKTIEPFCWWGITQLAAESNFHHNASLIFDKYLYPGYTNRKVLDNKSFPSHDAQTFVFSAEAVSGAETAVMLFERGYISLADADVQRRLEEVLQSFV